MSAQIVGQTDGGIVELTSTGTTVDLQVHLVEHTQTRRPDRMAEALEAAVDLAGYIAFGIEYTAPGEGTLQLWTRSSNQ